ncbi:MAG: hydrolase TatD [Gammaproteobacteria bacterium]|uniref:Hydrolase TatD n=1 Tax=Vreelandella venusta TaxID=44935 RepID=A0ABX2BJH0_9GAMM|nr:TatD family hydrolase [Halomonas venusta]MBR9926875.1 hydrolase TatD [Gammaproteobacteria bacterium]AZM95423.1 hydrolase TatD [Halomonas venusta]NPT32760.1 hydrolase TatD [Halomonas venusta]QPI65387.1 TatD family hydrolase [Halomonas venusta]WAM49802.1 TatD family hydrolase [Halomonas venusta]
MATSDVDSFLPEALQFRSDAPLVDIGANLTHESFQRDLADVIARAKAANVATLIVTGTDIEHAEQAVELAKQTPGIYATAGVHPHDASGWSSDVARQLKTLHQKPEVVAVGECGLDFNRNFSTPHEQELAFEAQLALAAESGLPLFLHERDAGQRMREMLHSWRDDISQAVIHCFTADRDTLHGYLDLDLHIGLTGWICDERRGHHLRSIVKDIPLDRLMVETDCPYLLPRNLPAKLKGRRHEPALLPWIVREIAQWHDVTETELGNATTRTAQHFFRLDTEA